ncbi:acid-sensing ion channel 4-B-like [Saccoglossus kowalevskii]
MRIPNMNHLLNKTAGKNTTTAEFMKVMKELDSIKRNFAKVQVYFEDLNVETITEVKAYQEENMLGDLGGTMGLFLGMSVISIMEFVEFILSLCGILIKPASKTSKKMRERSDSYAPTS